MLIQSENPRVFDALHALKTLVQANGGYIHPSCHVHHQGDRLWISCPEHALNATLMEIPDALFIPASPLHWYALDDALHFTDPEALLTPVQTALATAMCELYNATDKFRSVALRLPEQCLHSDSALQDWFSANRPQLKVSSASAAENFIQTRLYKKANAQPEQERIGYLMPLMDLMNHHPNARPYSQQQNGAWRVLAEHAQPGSSECFLQYNTADCLAQAFWHGYCETHCLQLTALQGVFAHELFGHIAFRIRQGKQGPVNFPRIIPDDHSLIFEDLVLAKENFPAQRTIIALAIRSKQRQLNQADAENIAGAVLLQIVGWNTAKYRELADICLKDTDAFPLRRLFGAVAQHQLQLLQGFHDHLLML